MRPRPEGRVPVHPASCVKIGGFRSKRYARKRRNRILGSSTLACVPCLTCTETIVAQTYTFAARGATGFFGGRGGGASRLSTASSRTGPSAPPGTSAHEGSGNPPSCAGRIQGVCDPVSGRQRCRQPVFRGVSLERQGADVPRDIEAVSGETWWLSLQRQGRKHGVSGEGRAYTATGTYRDLIRRAS